MQSYSEASNNFKYWTSKTRKERLEAAYYLNSVAYNFPIDDPPRMDKFILFVQDMHSYPTRINFLNENTLGFSEKRSFVSGQIFLNTSEPR